MTGLGPCGDDPDCEQALQAMYEYLDKELADEGRSTVQLHLDDCIHCLEAFEFETELKQIIANRCRDEVPEYLYERIRTSLRVEIERHKGPVGESSSEGGIPAV